MRALVVFESMFGNTEACARQVASGLADAGWHVAIADVRDVAPAAIRGCDLVVIGAPTHAFSLSRRSTREDAVRQGADPQRATMGVREWLDTLVDLVGDGKRPLVAVFDTRIEKVRRLPGSAARRAARELRGRGFEVVDRPTSFWVEDTAGPPAAGEVERAGVWAARLADLVVGAGSPG